MDEKRIRLEIEILKLFQEGCQILEIESRRNMGSTLEGEELIQFTYQQWYTKTLPVIRQLVPERYSEFVEQYKLEKRKTITYSTYTISDYLVGLRLTRNLDGKEAVKPFKAFNNKFTVQLAILQSCISRLDSILTDIKGTLQAELFDDELSAAEDLFKRGFLRAAGALAGVTLERHLATVATNHEVKISKRNPTIADFNEALKTAEVYDVPDWRFIQRLGDIRNLAVHNKDREPTKEEIDDLIKGVQKIIKTTF